jgi:DNA primase
MGAALYDRQRWLLTKHFQRLILMLDGDPAGRRASKAIAAQLARHCPVRVIQLAANIQPDQLSEEVIREILTKEGGKPESD